MPDVLTLIGKATSPGGAIDLGRLEIIRMGAIGATFHIASPQSSQVGARTYIAEFGHDEDWRSIYLNPDGRKHDPLPDYMMRQGESAILSDAIRVLAPDEEQIAWIERFYPKPWENIIAIPAYGPFDSDSFVSIIWPKALEGPDEPIVQNLVAIVEVVNRRVAQLMEGANAHAIRLSGRETEVLNWIGRSKSNVDIATILDLSVATVDTYVRRIFAKLGENDRISATLKGVRLGFIRH